MDSFGIENASGPGGLFFSDRTPGDPGRPIERFLVRLDGLDLSAIGRVYYIYNDDHPAPLFVAMAEKWRGWDGQLSWGSLEGELTLTCSQDRAGHVAIRVELRSGPMETDWSVRATVWAEAGQLEEMARKATAFFGGLG